MKKIFIFITLLLVGVSLVSCNLKDEPMLQIIGSDEVTQGIHETYTTKVASPDYKNEVIWSSSDEKVAIVDNGVVLGLTEGTVTISATLKQNKNYQCEKEIKVNKYVAEPYSQEMIDQANEILNNMTLEQKVGQMFIFGFDGTSLPNDVVQDINTYHFGNIIYMGRNCKDTSTLTAMSNAIQDAMMNANGVPAFISTDQEGGRVARIIDGATHFISEMAMGATGDYNNTYLEGQAMGYELSNYGINFDLTPVLDVNNNPANPVIGVRSYSDNPMEVSLYGIGMVAGLKENGVMACAKHFPGHGNTATDSHFGLPKITSSVDELYKIELAPYISAISHGIDAIMTTHIIFEAIDTEYPATLSSKVLQGLLRDQLGYEGLIVTDAMVMDAIKNYFGDTEAPVLAIKAGVDLLTYTEPISPINEYNSVLSAVQNNEISEERIDESVRRIILTKLKYNLFDNYHTEYQDMDRELSEHAILNREFADQSFTIIEGESFKLNKEQSILIISPTCNYTIDSLLDSQSLGCYASGFLSKQGFVQVDYVDVDRNITATQVGNIMDIIDNYDQIVLAFSNVKTSNYTDTISFVNNILTMNKKIINIALDSPYDYLVFDNIQLMVTEFGYQEATVRSLSRFLSGVEIGTGKVIYFPD